MDTLFGAKVYDTKKNHVGILIKTYNLGYVDAPEEMGAQVIDSNGKKYPQNMDYLIPVNDLSNEQIEKFNIPISFLID